MKKCVVLVASCLLVLSLFLLVPGKEASAQASSCYSPVSSSTTTAGGSTSAYISMTIWYDGCTGSYFGSVHSFADSNGFAFHGTLFYFSNGREATATVTGAGIFDTWELSPAPDYQGYLEFDNNNGVFHYAGGDWYWWSYNYVESNLVNL